MNTFSKALFAASIGAALLSSCSRPVAYFQRGPVAHFAAPKTETVAAVTPAEAAPAVNAPVVAPETVAPVSAAVAQVDAMVRNDSKLAADRKLTKRMAKVKELLATANANPALTTSATASAKKMSLLEKVVMKKMDKKIKHTLAPEKTQAMNSNVRLGVIIGIIGLLLLILGGGSALGIIGAIGLIVGLVLILLGIINS